MRFQDIAKAVAETYRTVIEADNPHDRGTYLSLSRALSQQELVGRLGALGFGEAQAREFIIDCLTDAEPAEPRPFMDGDMVVDLVNNSGEVVKVDVTSGVCVRLRSGMCRWYHPTQLRHWDNYVADGDPDWSVE